jgi:hypothetical protein
VLIIETKLTMETSEWKVFVFLNYLSKLAKFNLNQLPFPDLSACDV